MKYTPSLNAESFQCPHCNIVSQQTWFHQRNVLSIVDTISTHFFLNYRSQISEYQQEAIKKFLEKIRIENRNKLPSFIPNDFSIGNCFNCKNITIWIENTLIYPRQVTLDPPNPDMNQEIQDLYNEASKILLDSPKGATALLRLALQLLLKQVGKSGKNINNDIKELVADGLSPKIQQALDLLRVIGNNAVHPGQINLDDNKEIAIKLFQLLNFITSEMITKPKELDSLYNNLIPEDTKIHIKERDGI